MKKFIILILSLALLSAVVGSVIGVQASNLTELFAKGRTTKGSGKIVSRTQTVGKFDAVSASRAIRVKIGNTRSNDLLIEADDNLLDKVVAEVDDEGTLVIGFDKSVGSLADHHVAVTVPYNKRINTLKASSAALIVCEPELTARKISLKASSSARIEADAACYDCEADASSAACIKGAFKAEECSLDASSSACITADVTATDCELKLSSAAELIVKAWASRGTLSSAAVLHGEEFAVRNADIRTSSGSSAHIFCTENLRANASSGSSIRYTGDCNATSTSSSGGSIRKK